MRVTPFAGLRIARDALSDQITPQVYVYLAGRYCITARSRVALLARAHLQPDCILGARFSARSSNVSGRECLLAGVPARRTRSKPLGKITVTR